MNKNIDFVILWVDNNDKEWQKEKEKYSKQYKNIDDRNIRYRDWDTLKYWFRGVEKFAPWVNKIHFITYGHLPKWLNTKNPKLNIVKHSDYIPQYALPTFNSNAIEVNIHKIKNLEEQFVLFNDDTFIIKKLNKKDFFKNGKPCNTMSLEAIIPFPNNDFYKTKANNIEIINKHFNFKKSKRENLLKYLSLKRGKYIFKTYPFLIYNKFPGFANYHMPNAYLKSTFEEVWEKEKDALEKTMCSKFRDNKNNINHWLFNYWQFASGNYNQKNYKFGLDIKINDKNATKYIEKQKYKVLGLEDTDNINNIEEIKEKIIKSFEKILPDKSSFEK